MTFQKNQGNIAIIQLQSKDQNPELVNQGYNEDLLENIIRLENDPDLKGVIIRFAKNSYLPKYDIENLFKVDKADMCFEYIESQKHILRRIENLKVPVVAAINCSLVGLGMELALACNYRIAVDTAESQFEFSEVKHGIIPGYGGIIRLTRTIGIEKSLPLLLNGNQFNAKQALDFGFLNKLENSNDKMINKSIQWIKANQNTLQPWDQQNFIFPHGNAHEGQNPALISAYPGKIRKKTRGNFPAPESILSIAVEGSLVDFVTACRLESRFYTELLLKKATKNIIKANWFQLKKIQSGLSRPQKIPKTTISKVGVVGSGLMGHGIAYVSAKAGLEVVMVDSNQSNADKGLKKIKKILLSDVKKHAITDSIAKDILYRINATDKYENLNGCDLILEAVYEDKKLKGKVTIEVERHIQNDKVFASNTSTIPITDLAENSNSPESFIGIHFFSPVNQMKLVEIIKGEKTSKSTLAKAFDFALKIEKIPLVVSDSRGFYTTRVFERYAKEGMALLHEGNHPVSIESAARAAGFPVGPLAVIDEISIQLLADIRNQSGNDLNPKKTESESSWNDVIDYMLKIANRPGRAAGKGFYEYPTKREKYISSEVVKYFYKSQNSSNQDEMVERFYFSQSIEAVRCFEEKIVTSAADANIGSIFGWGFPLFSGGVIQFINNYGLEEFRDRANILCDRHGERFCPPKLLNRMIDNGEDCFK